MSRRDAFDAGHNNPAYKAQLRAQKAGEAWGSHIWDTMEEAMGGPGSFRASHVLGAWNEAHQLKGRPGGEDLDIRPDPDDDDYPVVHLPGPGGISFRHPVGGPYMDVHVNGEAVDTIHMGEPAERTDPEHIKRRAAEYEPWDYE